MRKSQEHTVKLEKTNRNDSNLTLSVTIKDAATTKRRLKVVGYYQVEYLYIFLNQGILFLFKDYSIIEQNKMVGLAT